MNVPTVAITGVPDPLPEGLTVLDVREPVEWQYGHIAGALHIPLGELTGRLDEVPDGQTLVVCKVGSRSAYAAGWLVQQGRDAVNLDGGMLDWEANIDPEFGKHRLFHPKPVKPEAEMQSQGFREVWVSCSSVNYSAKELTVRPGRSVVIRDAAAYGVIVVQGGGSVGKVEVETPTLIRYGQMTQDELFVTAAAARRGVTITNRSDTENLVMLKHFGPGNPDMQ